MATRGNVKLTESRVKAMRPGANVICLWDSVVPGFHARIYKSGAQSYAVRFQRPDKTKVVVTIGAVGVFSLDAARENARKLRELHDNGKDARAHMKDQRGAKDLTALASLWRDDYRDKLKPTSQCSYDSIIKVIILPAIGSRLVKDLDYPSVKDLHRKVSKVQPVGANRMITVLSRLMNIAEMEGWRPRGTNPCVRFPKTKETSCQRILTAAELARLEAAMAGLEEAGKLDQVAADLFRVLALSGLRIREASHLKWRDINLTKNTMTITDHKTAATMGPKVLPLNQPLRDVLKRRAGFKLGAYVFPGLKEGTLDTDGKRISAPIVGLRKMWLRVLKVKGCNLKDVTPHDLRRTFMTTCTELGYPPAIGDTLLGHSLGKITDTYTRLSTDGILSSASTDTALWIAAAMRGAKPKNGEKVATKDASAKQA